MGSAPAPGLPFSALCHLARAAYELQELSASFRCFHRAPGNAKHGSIYCLRAEGHKGLHLHPFRDEPWIYWPADEERPASHAELQELAAILDPATFPPEAP